MHVASVLHARIRPPPKELLCCTALHTGPDLYGLNRYANPVSGRVCSVVAFRKSCPYPPEADGLFNIQQVIVVNELNATERIRSYCFDCKYFVSIELRQSVHTGVNPSAITLEHTVTLTVRNTQPHTNVVVSLR